MWGCGAGLQEFYRVVDLQLHPENAHAADAVATRTGAERDRMYRDEEIRKALARSVMASVLINAELSGTRSGRRGGRSRGGPPSSGGGGSSGWGGSGGCPSGTVSNARHVYLVLT